MLCTSHTPQPICWKTSLLFSRCLLIMVPSYLRLSQGHPDHHCKSFVCASVCLPMRPITPFCACVCTLCGRLGDKMSALGASSCVLSLLIVVPHGDEVNNTPTLTHMHTHTNMKRPTHGHMDTRKHTQIQTQTNTNTHTYMHTRTQAHRNMHILMTHTVIIQIDKGKAIGPRHTYRHTYTQTDAHTNIVNSIA